MSLALPFARALRPTARAELAALAITGALLVTATVGLASATFDQPLPVAPPPVQLG